MFPLPGGWKKSRDSSPSSARRRAAPLVPPTPIGAKNFDIRRWYNKYYWQRFGTISMRLARQILC
jgi:hypothetical protein